MSPTISPDHTQYPLLTDMEEGDSNQANSNNSQTKSQQSAVSKCILNFLITVLCCYISFSLVADLLRYPLVVLVPKLVTLLAIICAPVVIPLLMVAFLVARFLLFIKSGDGFDKAIRLKYFTLSLIFLAVLEILIEMGIFYLIAKHASSLKHVSLVGLPLTEWVNITYMICGFFSLSYCLSLLMHGVLEQILYWKAAIVCSIYVREAVSEIFNCLIFWWAVSDVMKRVPTFKQHQVLGLQTQRWIEAAIFALIGHDIIALATHVFVWLLRLRLRALDKTEPTWYKVFKELVPTENLEYCAHGMRRGVSFILSSVLLLLIWVLYVGSHLKETVEAKRVLDFGNSTFVSLLMCSLLCLIKDCVVLAWEANRVYSRLSSEIIENGKKLYFLGLFSRHKYDVFNLRYAAYGEKVGFFGYVLELIGSHNKYLPTNCDPEDTSLGKTEDGPKDTDLEEIEESKRPNWPTEKKKTTKLSTIKRNIVRDHLLLSKDQTTLHDIKQVAEYFLIAKNTLSNGNYPSDIIDYLKENGPRDRDGQGDNVDLKQLIVINDDEKSKDESQGSCGDPSSNQQRKERIEKEEKDWQVFEAILKKADNKTLFENFQTWMKKAHESCLFLANMIKSDKEGADCLNTVMSLVLIGTTFIMWLLLTGLASTTVFVAIASPLVAASFIFGETCKNLFEGFIFVYVVRPFDVGDTCDISGEERLLVKSIGVWETTFLKTNNTVEVIYPNSKLAKQKVTNHKILKQASEEEAKAKPNTEHTLGETSQSKDLIIQESSNSWS